MESYSFIVDFGDNSFGVTAKNKREAKIKAKYHRIQRGKHYNIESVKNVTTNKTFRVI